MCLPSTQVCLAETTLLCLRRSTWIQSEQNILCGMVPVVLWVQIGDCVVCDVTCLIRPLCLRYFSGLRPSHRTSFSPRASRARRKRAWFAESACVNAASRPFLCLLCKLSAASSSKGGVGWYRNTPVHDFSSCGHRDVQADGSAFHNS